MNKQSVEVIESIRGLITVESDDNGRDVIIYIRETRNAIVTEEASIRISPETLYNLMKPIMRKVADEIRLDEEMI